MNTDLIALKDNSPFTIVPPSNNHTHNQEMVERRDFSSTYHNERRKWAEQEEERVQKTSPKTTANDQDKTAEQHRRSEAAVDKSEENAATKASEENARQRKRGAESSGKILPREERSGNDLQVSKAEDTESNQTSGDPELATTVIVDQLQGDASAPTNMEEALAAAEASANHIESESEESVQSAKILNSENIEVTEGDPLTKNPDDMAVEDNDDPHDQIDENGGAIVNYSDSASREKLHRIAAFSGSEKDSSRKSTQNISIQSDEKVALSNEVDRQTRVEAVARSDAAENSKPMFGEQLSKLSQSAVRAPEASKKVDQGALTQNVSRDKSDATIVGNALNLENKPTVNEGELYIRQDGENFEQQMKALSEKVKAEIKPPMAERIDNMATGLKELKNGLGKGVEFVRTVASEKFPLRDIIDVPVSHKNWGAALAEKTALLVNQKGSFARLNLIPHNLGPLEVRVQLHGDASSLDFIAINPTTKDAIESALPRLREMFESGGLNLSNVNVSSQSDGNGNAQKAIAQHESEASSSDEAEEENMEVSISTDDALPSGRVDFYA